MPDPGDSRRFATHAPRASGWLEIEVVENGGDWSRFGGGCDLVTAAGVALARHGRFRNEQPAEACIALSDDATVRDLNARFRGKSSATNVLSFPAGGRHGKSIGAARSLGDVVLAEQTVMREAVEQSVPPAHHLQHLVVHGLLHLLGLDHETEAEAREMEALEVEILSTLGIPNPYADELETCEPARARARMATDR